MMNKSILVLTPFSLRGCRFRQPHHMRHQETQNVPVSSCRVLIAHEPLRKDSRPLLSALNVDEDIVWDSVTQELQPLIDELKKIVPPENA